MLAAMNELPVEIREPDDEILRALAFIYLCCAKTGDDELAPEEVTQIHDKLFIRLLELQLVNEQARPISALREKSREITAGAARAFRGARDHEGLLSRLDADARFLRARLAPPARERILLDLLQLAAADGTVSPGESAFVEAIARTFEVPLTVVVAGPRTDPSPS